VDSAVSEPPGKPKIIAVGSLSVLQGNFPTQESNQDLLHCRWILYQLSYLLSHFLLVCSHIIISKSPSLVILSKTEPPQPHHSLFPLSLFSFIALEPN